MPEYYMPESYVDWGAWGDGITTTNIATTATSTEFSTFANEYLIDDIADLAKIEDFDTTEIDKYIEMLEKEAVVTKE